jgi:LPS-assembly protein
VSLVVASKGSKVRSGRAMAGRTFVASIVSLSLFAAGPYSVAQPVEPFGDLADQALPAVADKKLLLEADQLTYDFDNETVTATGNVQIYYEDYVLDAETVTYHQKSGRLIASGGVRLLEPGGNLVSAERLDITDDFRDAFVGSLNVVTTDRARFTAQTAERRDGNLTIFHKGIYTACEPCLKHPERPPLWQIKAARIIHDRSAQTIYYENARLEFFGVPIAYTPIFFHPDPTVRRKTGFLTPSFIESDAIGVGVTTPFFWNLAPNYDVTFSPTFLSRQGVLMQSEFRHRVLNGSYNIRAAGIFQLEKDAFVDDDGVPLSGHRDFRGGVHTDGAFDLNADWVFGWSLNATTDRTFNRDYRIPGLKAKDLPSTIYLTGMNDRNYFDVSGHYFSVQREDTEEDLPDDGDPTTLDVYQHDDQAEQAVVHPVLDHNYIVGQSIFGGELALDSNLTSVTRDESDIRHPTAPFGTYFAGVAGSFTRATSRGSWKRRLILPGGQLITPFTYVQADLNWIDSDDPAAGLASESVNGRVMPAVGLEYEWPILATLGSTVHTFGPKAQIIARPSEWHPGSLPNEDSQSLIFDDTNLFEWDKFAGYDRQEGGTRANLGFVYQGLFAGGASVDAVAGRSVQVAGDNSFALKDHALTGVGSGLETKWSDYLARVTVNTGMGLAATGRARVDDEDLQFNRGELGAVASFGGSTASLDYAYIRESPASGIFRLREEVTAAASIEFTDNWSVLGSLVYDLRNDARVGHSLGLSYEDECLVLSAIYSETTDPYSDLASEREIFLRISLRNLGDTTFSSQLSDDYPTTASTP